MSTTTSSITSNTVAGNASTVALPAIAEQLLTLKGQFVGLNWVRPLKTYKGESRKVTKSVRTVVQIGASYDNRASVKDARESGELPSENAGLSGKEWVQYPIILRAVKTGKLYLRVYPVRDAAGNARSCKTIYKVDGEMVRRDDAKAICLAGEFSSSPKPFDCYDVSVDSLTAVRLARRAEAKVNLLGK